MEKSVELIMPPWDYDEIYDAHKLISKFKILKCGYRYRPKSARDLWRSATFHFRQVKSGNRAHGFCFKLEGRSYCSTDVYIGMGQWKRGGHIICHFSHVAAEVAEAVKAVQSQVVDVGAKIEKTEAALDAADLSSEKRVVLVMKLKSLKNEELKLMDEELKLKDEELKLMDEELKLMDEELKLMTKEGLIVTIKSNDYFISLQDAKLNGRVLCVGGTQHFFSHELYVRDCWVEMYEVMEDMLKSGCQRIVVTGTPGIGKSQFLQYCMWRMAQKNEAFLHETYPQMVHMYSPGNFATYNYNNIPSGLPYLVDLEAETLPFYDYAKWSPLFTAIFSSPNPYRFKSMVKMDNSVELIMPPWENEEIFDAHKLISKFRSVDIDLVKSQLAIYGGVPRYVFDKSKEGSRPMKQALRSKGQLVAERMFMVDWVESGKDVDMSYTISHMIPEDTVKFTGRLFSPASTFVLENLMETHSAIVLEKVLQIVRMKENAGCLFEFVASRFALADETHNASRLESESASKSSNSAKSRTFTVGNFVSLPPEWRNGNWMPKQDVLYYQNKVNLQSVDAFTIIDRELVFFQLTIGSQHSVKAKGLSDILNLFSRGGGGLPWWIHAP